MTIHRFTVLALLGLAACVQAAAVDKADLAIPDAEPVSASEMAALVDGGPYQMRIYSGEFAGTSGRNVWDFDAMTVSGSFVSASGETGTYTLPISIEGDQLCSGEGAAKTCHMVYPYRGGFMEVTPSNQIHAVSLPV